jgi:hypothetical protein
MGFIPILLCACDVLLPDLRCSSLNPLSILVFHLLQSVSVSADEDITMSDASTASIEVQGPITW